MEYSEKQLTETCLSSELIFDGRVVRLFVDTVALPNGESSIREYVRGYQVSGKALRYSSTFC